MALVRALRRSSRAFTTADNLSEGGGITMWIHRDSSRLANASGEVDLQTKASLVDEDPNYGSPQWNADAHKLSKGQDDQGGGQEEAGQQ